MKLLMEQWRKYLKEDAAARKEFADDLAQVAGYEHGMVFGKEDAYKKMMSQGRTLKKLFAKHADQNFLNSLVTIHWGRYQDIREFVQFGKEDRSDRDELSCAAYLPGQVRGASYRHGLVVKGRITLLANSMDDLYTGFGREYRKTAPSRAKMSGANKGVGRSHRPKEYMEDKILVLDKDDWDPSGKKYQLNEALVDNWKIVAIISDEKEKPALETIAKGVGFDVPVILPSEVNKL